MSGELRIWRLHTCCNHFTSVDTPSEGLNYFNSHFNGEPMVANWKFPEVTLSGKSKKLADFLGWSKGVELVSEKAMHCLKPVLNEYVEFLPFHEIKGKPYYALNVLQLEGDLLDIAHSDVTFYPGKPALQENIAYITTAFFKMTLPEKLPPIFKLTYRPGRVGADIFVTKAFADIAIEYQLTGIELADPRQDSLSYVIRDLPQNVVPGIVLCPYKKKTV